MKSPAKIKHVFIFYQRRMDAELNMNKEIEEFMAAFENTNVVVRTYSSRTEFGPFRILIVPV